ALFGADDRKRNHRYARAQRELDVAAAAEALQLVPLAERLADALHALGKHREQLAPRQQAPGVLRARPHGAYAVQERPEEWRMEYEIVGQPTQRTPITARVAQRGLEHHAVPRQRAGVVAHEQRRALGGHVLGARDAYAEVPLVEHIEHRLHAR